MTEKYQTFQVSSTHHVRDTCIKNNGRGHHSDAPCPLIVYNMKFKLFIEKESITYEKMKYIFILKARKNRSETL
jgi:hypothetical protein